MPDLTIVETEIKVVSIGELQESGILSIIFKLVQDQINAEHHAEMEQKNQRRQDSLAEGGNVVSINNQENERVMNQWLTLRDAAPATVTELVSRYKAGEKAFDDCWAGFESDNLFKYGRAIDHALKQEGYALRVL